MRLVLALAQAGAPAPADPIGGGLADYFKLMLTLAGVAALAFFALRYWLPRMTGLRPPDSGPIRVAARLALEPRKHLYIVKAGTDYMLLGASESGLQYLAPLEASGIEPALASLHNPPSTDFSWLVKAFARGKGSSQGG
ncbi:MAG TPA: flagellar biosynthetic protein FliO [Bryobacteraceae bacterium]|nr:flagellar biosynthetic protein FliO [Bryobacteraceae bacterium]